MDTVGVDEGGIVITPGMHPSKIQFSHNCRTPSVVNHYRLEGVLLLLERVLAPKFDAVFARHCHTVRRLPQCVTLPAVEVPFQSSCITFAPTPHRVTKECSKFHASRLH